LGIPELEVGVGNVVPGGSCLKIVLFLTVYSVFLRLEQSVDIRSLGEGNDLLFWRSNRVMYAFLTINDGPEARKHCASTRD
jgi:hypothetical protein